MKKTEINIYHIGDKLSHLIFTTTPDNDGCLAGDTTQCLWLWLGTDTCLNQCPGWLILSSASSWCPSSLLQIRAPVVTAFFHSTVVALGYHAFPSVLQPLWTHWGLTCPYFPSPRMLSPWIPCWGLLIFCLCTCGGRWCTPYFFYCWNSFFLTK